MIHITLQVAAGAAALGAMCGLVYCMVCLVAALGFRRERNRDSGLSQSTAAVSVLKPLKGTDPQMYETLASHCRQSYQEYEIIFGVGDAGDPAVAEVNRLKVEFPQRSIRLLVCEEDLGTNTKVSNLAQMLRHASHEHIVVNDSDIRVGPDYLRRVLAPLAGPRTGMVTCLYRGVAASTLGSRLESLGISSDFCAGVLAARKLEGGIHFGLGSTLAFRRHDLKAIGGFEAVVDYLADDYEIGKRISNLGLRVQLATEIVETFLPPYTMEQFLQHQLRWARTIRASRPTGYAGLCLTFGMVWALLAVLFSAGAAWAWILLGGVLLARVAVALAVGRFVLNDKHVLRLLPVLPVRDILGVLVWIAGFTGSTVSWRGDSFTLKDGKLARTRL